MTTSAKATHKKIQYLVVDDDAPYLERMVRALRRRGFAARGAASLEELLQCIQVKVPDRIILDLRIGNESGLQCLVRLQEEGLRIPTVMVTGYGSVATAVEAMRLGCVHYLTRPVSLDQIIAAFESEPMGASFESLRTPPPSLEEVEWDHLQRTLTDYDGNITKAAKVLGLHRRSLQRKLTRLSAWKDAQR